VDNDKISSTNFEKKFEKKYAEFMEIYDEYMEQLNGTSWGVSFYKKEFDRSGNPLYMLKILDSCRENKIVIPQYAIQWMTAGFMKYFVNEGKISLDEIFKFKVGKKKNPIKKDIDSMDEILDTAMAKIAMNCRENNVSIEDAVYQFKAESEFWPDDVKYTEETLLKKCKTSHFFRYLRDYPHG